MGYDLGVDDKATFKHYFWGAFLLLAIFSVFHGLANGTFEGPDCSLSINSQEIACLPEEEPESKTGWDPDGPGEPYDGGDYPAP